MSDPQQSIPFNPLSSQCVEHMNQIRDMANDLQYLRQRIDSQTSSIDSIKNTLRGNGQLGIVAKVSILWNVHIWGVGLIGVALGSLITVLITVAIGG